MKDEYISLSIAGAVGLFSAGFLLALMMTEGVNAGLLITLIMVLIVVRTDARDPTVTGEYKRGRFVWRRVGPVKVGAGDSK